jgi:hypothetical protein
MARTRWSVTLPKQFQEETETQPQCDNQENQLPGGLMQMLNLVEAEKIEF